MSRTPMRAIHPRIIREPNRVQDKHRRYHPAMMALIGTAGVILSAGTQDRLHFWRQGKNDLYVLSINRSMGYVGLQYYDLSDISMTLTDPDDMPRLKQRRLLLPIVIGRDQDGIFMQNATEDLGEGWDDQSPATLRDRLMEWFQ